MKKRTLFTLAAVFTVAAGLFFFFLRDRQDTTSDGVSTEQAKSLLTSGSDTGYVDPQACEPCHSRIYETYRDVGMARAFFRPTPERMIADWSDNNVYYHEKSDRYYTMYERDGKYYQRRHQIGYDGQETNILEKEIHFVLGSGNHARTYLHLTPDRRLIELPVSWYSEKGGYWAMNPGYDRPDHLAFRRHITYECMFCHNGYPVIEPDSDRLGQEAFFKGKIPEGIDCQRCHGPGREHIETVRNPNADLESVRSSIVNPARLSPERQLETCMQCHLETTSSRLPAHLHRYDRNLFSFRPGEPLEDYILHFDHARGAGYDDKFEIVSAPYRLRLSTCFKESDGQLTCLTCHDPHDVPRGEEAVEHYVSVCKSCHESTLQKLIASNRHTPSEDCLGCHMPKRRTDNVVHVVMTDHFIQRFKPERDLLAPLEETEPQYRGEVVLYYPPDLRETGENELYLAVAQVKHNANLKQGIARLERAVENHEPEHPHFYYELAEAYSEDGQIDKAIPWYEEALRQDPNHSMARHGLGKAWLRLGKHARAVEELQKVAALGVDEATVLTDLALTYTAMGENNEAVRTFKRALRIDPDKPEAYNNMGGVLLTLGNLSEAEDAFRKAIRLQPDFAGAHYNLAKILTHKQDFRRAQHHFEKALRHNPRHVEARHDYGLTLAQMGLYNQARAQLEAALKLEPDRAGTHFDLGMILAAQGQTERALPHLRQAAESSDPDLRREALALIEQISPGPGRAR